MLCVVIWTPRNRAMKANSPHVTGRIDALHPIGLVLQCRDGELDRKS